MSTRRHQRSEARREQTIVSSVAAYMAEFQEHAHEAKHYLVVSSVHPELAVERDSRDTSITEFRVTHARIEGFIRTRQWQSLREFVAELRRQSDIFIADSQASLESGLRDYEQRFSAFGVGVAYSVVWLAEPKIYYLLLWKD